MSEQTAESIKLNLGAGDTVIPGFVPLDIKNGKSIFPLEGYADNSVDEVRASHVLEHFGQAQTIPVMREWVRVLKPGGVLRIAVPNFEWCMAHYADQESWPIEGFICGGQTDEHDWHYSLWTPQKLRAVLTAVGLVDIQPWQSEIADCASLPVSLNLQGRKLRDGESAPKPFNFGNFKISICTSMPRLCFSDFFQSTLTQFQGLNCHFWRGEGAFWGQCLERSLMSAVSDKPDFIFTLDYDTVFTADNIRKMMLLMYNHPECDAIVPMQQGRQRSSPLFTTRDAQGILTGALPFSQLNAELMPISSGHFGCTIFRPSAFDKLTHPWFKEVPGVFGTWDETKTDPDIFFWRHWIDSGNSVYLAPRVCVGHCELMVSWPAPDLSHAVFQHPNDFQNNGQMEGTWGKAPLA